MPTEQALTYKIGDIVKTVTNDHYNGSLGEIAAIGLDNVGCMVNILKAPSNLISKMRVPFTNDGLEKISLLNRRLTT